MADRWHKQIAVRFPPADLEALDRLVKADYGAAQRPWYQYGRATRSSVILGLVKEADRKARAAELDAEERAAKKPTKKKPTKRGTR